MSSHSICLRRHPATSWRLKTLEENEFASSAQMATLRSLLENRANFLIVGPTGTGKTSLMSALLGELSLNERVLIIEDTSEINVPNSLSIKLLTRSDCGALKSYDQSDLVRQSLRMRPSRIVVGEVRGNEAKDLLLALSTGHSGSLGSIHANGAREALLRLEMLVQMGAPSWSLDTIRRLIHLSLQYLIVLEMVDQKRRLAGIFKIASLEKCGFLLEPIT